MKHVKYGIISITPNHNKLTFRLIHIIYNISWLTWFVRSQVRVVSVTPGYPWHAIHWGTNDQTQYAAHSNWPSHVWVLPKSSCVHVPWSSPYAESAELTWQKKKNKINNLGTNKNSWVIQQHLQQLIWWCVQWHMNSKLERMENKAIMAQLELIFQHFPEREKLQENSSRMDSFCTQNWIQDFQKDWYCLDHDIQWRQLVSG